MHVLVSVLVLASLPRVCVVNSLRLLACSSCCAPTYGTLLEQDLCHQVPAAGRAFEELLNMESRLNSLSLAMDILEESTTSLEQAALTE